MFWFFMIFGNGLLFTFYTLESAARRFISDEYAYSQYGSLQYLYPRIFMQI